MNRIKNKTIFYLAIIITFFSTQKTFGQYNNLWIPDTLSGTTFNLTIKDTFAQYRTGNQTITSAVNNSKFWGPTLFFNKGDSVHMNVHNTLNDSITIHWHGFHLPAIMDGGPHQVVPQGTYWQPYWKVTNNAATYWYHPHLHTMTQEQLTKGVGGFIIVRDSLESTLTLPRKYGVDDIPLALTSRRFDASNAFVFVNCSYGDSLLTNGVTRAQVSLPKQYVRLRILNAEMERAYNIGFSDNRTFYIIANDGGLVNTPVPVTKVIVGVGERIEILVNLSGDPINSSLDLKAYNAGFALGFPGGEPNTSGQFGSALNNTTFNLLHINIIAPTANPVTTMPATLANNTYWTAADATINRTVTVTGGQAGTPFSFDNTPFVLTTINKTVNLNAIEKWTITNNNIFGHSFHIHDIEFKIVSRSSGSVGTHEGGWKDVLYLPKGESATFVAKFDDYSDSIHPFMYHCHFSPHEDGGMMGQFVVKSLTVVPLNLLSFTVQPDNNKVLLNWSATNQVNTKIFIIERSNNSIAWYAIDSVISYNTPGINNYAVTDLKPMFGINYYRLKSVDRDGKFTYSEIRFIETGEETFQFTLYPNPARSRIYFHFNDPLYSIYYIRVTDKLGRTKYMLPRPQLQNGIDISNFSAGNYFIQVTDEKTMKTVTRKFTKE